MLQKVFSLIFLLAMLESCVNGDTPANCTFEDIAGTWNFHIGPTNGTNTINCSQPFSPVKSVQVELKFPNLAFDVDGNEEKPHFKWKIISTRQDLSPQQVYSFAVKDEPVYQPTKCMSASKIITHGLFGSPLLERLDRCSAGSFVSSAAVAKDRVAGFTALGTTFPNHSPVLIHLYLERAVTSRLVIANLRIKATTSRWVIATPFIFSNTARFSIFIGTWTMIYNQGFEVTILGLKYFAFSLYKQEGSTVESICDTTFPGWVHGINERNWGCYTGSKQSQSRKITEVKEPLQSPEPNKPFRMSKSFLAEINRKQTSWKATEYKQYQYMTNAEVIRMAGGRRSASAFPPTTAVTDNIEVTRPLPPSFDWRNKDGVNYISPIRNQASCGSCYAFGSMALHEARLRIMSNNSIQTIFSTQDIVSCSEYSQGCEGGFPYLIAGKYGQDFGFIAEDCYPYEGKDSPCKKSTCKRHYTRDYYYIGGYYGACSEPLMRAELVKNGPIAVSFEVYKDFLAYKSGVYHHTTAEDKFNPWEITNHVVLIVGYGEEDGIKFWIVKNSWGTDWGEEGFFRIRRGNDECSIESMAVGTFPIAD